MGWSPLRALLVAIVLATLYGVTDEFHQSFVPNRNTDPKDVLVDFLGATAGPWPRCGSWIGEQLRLVGRRMLPQTRRRTGVPDESGQRDQRQKIRQGQKQLGGNSDSFDLSLNL